MSMLTQRFEQPAHSSGDARAAGLWKAHRTTIKRLWLRALALMLMGGVLACLIALKTAAFLWRLHY
jgi:ferric-dicitrate binding protein FerR (iron transport regulator)